MVFTTVGLAFYAVLALGSAKSEKPARRERGNRSATAAETADPAEGAPAAPATPATPVTPVTPAPSGNGFCPTAKGTPNACGWAVDASACTACVTSKCCEEGRSCARDCACVACTESTSPALCTGKNASFDGALGCMKTKCAAACGLQPSTAGNGGSVPSGPQTQGGKCRATRCTAGASGDALCKKLGCSGGCFFGGCNGF